MQAALLQAQKMEAIGQLTGGLAHDFNNLLTVIIGNLAALQDHRPNDPAVHEFAEPALQSARRGAQLIKRLLTFSRQQPLAPQAIDIGEMLGDLACLLRRSLPESIALSTDCGGEAIHALADPAQLESALLNFALNARDAMPDGGRLHIAARSVELGSDADAFELSPGRYALIEIADNGSGMDNDTLARACEPFFTTKRLGLGSGLGLAMAYGFARQSGGGLVLRSQPGQGTCVLLALPHTHPETLADDDAGEPLPGNDNDLILLVEDDPAVRRVVRQQLIDLGHPVIEADSADQALALVDQVADIALVLTDMVMPGTLNGRQLAGILRARRPDIRVVLMSGYADGANAGPDVLAKPSTATRWPGHWPTAARRSHEGQRTSDRHRRRRPGHCPHHRTGTRRLRLPYRLVPQRRRPVAPTAQPLPLICALPGTAGHGRARSDAAHPRTKRLRDHDPDRPRPRQRSRDGARTGGRRLCAETLRTARTGRPRAAFCVAVLAARTPRANASPASAAGVSISATTRLSAPDGREQVLSTAEAELLKTFVHQPNRILPRDKLMGSRDVSPSDRAIDVRISRLRRKLEPDADSPGMIKTVYGAGYLFLANVEWPEKA